jgi:hypothetical protein
MSESLNHGRVLFYGDTSHPTSGEVVTSTWFKAIRYLLHSIWGFLSVAARKTVGIEFEDGPPTFHEIRSLNE